MGFPTEILASIVGNIVPSVLVEYWNYHREADQHVKNLKRKWDLLEGRRDDKKKILGSELRQGKKPKKEVKTWLRNVRTIKGDIDIGQVPARWMFFSRMQKGESAFKKTKDVEELYQAGDFTDGLVLDLPERIGKEGIAADSRTPKYRRSSENVADSVSFVAAPVNEDEEKRKARLMRNRERAQFLRQRKKLEELEDKVRSLDSTITELNSKISYIMAENATLRQQSSGNVQPPVPKVNKSENRKSKGKTKKVASVSFLGLLFFVILYGGLVPFVNVRYGGIGDKVPGGVGYVSDTMYDIQLRRVSSANEYSNGSGGSVGGGFSSWEFDNPNRVNYVRGRVLNEEYERKGQGLQPLPGSDESMASQAEPEKKDNKETGLAIRRDSAQALAIPEVGGNRGRHSHVCRNLTGGQKALACRLADTLKDNLKWTPADGELQQWFYVNYIGSGRVGFTATATRPDPRSMGLGWEGQVLGQVCL